jgi:radical SAM enzyme (TIGR01210 family)
MSDIIERLEHIVVDSTIKARGTSIAKRRRRNPTKPSAKWVASARIGNEVGVALAVVLGTVGCSHARGDSGGCTMCSYLLDGDERSPTTDELLQQFDTALLDLADESTPLSVKIYTSGSFFDTVEIPADARAKIFARIAEDERIQEVVIESRPDYVTPELMRETRDILGSRRIEIGIGLESSNDAIRSICINKGFDLDTFKDSVANAKEYDIGVRAYILLKPPFLTERDALLDAVKTIEDAARLGVSTVSMNPINIQKYTLVERLWSKELYRPPWLWTVMSVLRDAWAKVGSSVNILCDPVAAGKPRGAHNCGSCDESITSAIREFSIHQDVSVFDSLDCDCKRQWHHILNHEDISLLIHSRSRRKPVGKA